MKYAIAIIAALALAGCYHTKGADGQDGKPGTSGESFSLITFEGQKATPAERARCETAGGEVRRDGLAGFELCLQDYPDAGKACTSGADCLGDCRAVDESKVQFGQPTVGQCQAVTSPFGCFTRVEGGLAEPTLCVD